MQLAIKAIKDQSINIKPIIKSKIKKSIEDYSSGSEEPDEIEEHKSYVVKKFRRIGRYSSISIQQLTKNL